MRITKEPSEGQTIRLDGQHITTTWVKLGSTIYFIISTETACYKTVKFVSGMHTGQYNLSFNSSAKAILLDDSNMELRYSI